MLTSLMATRIMEADIGATGSAWRLFLGEKGGEGGWNER